jgi:tetratricopeptide (TPR) repeat protein
MRQIRTLVVAVAAVALVFAGFVWMQDAPLREARQLLQQEKYEEAHRRVGEWEREHGSTGHSQALTAQALVGLGSHRNALRIFEQIGAANPDELHAWAKAYLSLEQWSQALPLLTGLHSSQPEDPDVLHELAACQAQLGLYDDAMKSAEKFREQGSKTHRAMLLIGSIHLKRGNKSAALQAWEEIAAHDPEYRDLQLPPEEFLTQIASLQIEQGNVKEADRLLVHALKIRETAEALFQYGVAADLEGNATAATERWLSALELDTRHLNARESLARQAISRGNIEEAQQWLQPLLEQKPLRSSTAYLMLRLSQSKKDSQQTAYWQQQVEDLRRRETMDASVNRVLTENPDSFWARIIRSYQFAEQGNFQQAKLLLDEVRQDNEDPFVTDLRKAVESQSPLPDKNRLPINLF